MRSNHHTFHTVRVDCRVCFTVQVLLSMLRDNFCVDKSKCRDSLQNWLIQVLQNQNIKETKGIEGCKSFSTLNGAQLTKNNMMIKAIVLATCLFLWRIPSEMRPPSWFWCKSLTLEEFLRTFNMATTPLVKMMKKEIARPPLAIYSTIRIPLKRLCTIAYIMPLSHMLTSFTFNFVKVINVLCFRGLQMAKERSILNSTSVTTEAVTNTSISAWATRSATESQN
ncbi:hypothetical protein OS493_032917 [Desmophyllum pertusum]|uniref:Uncharacterized protein n=1 Tax=Desmophyllum pertusum TaxID=174260 RepID=A0A9W9YM70_9CNID|nr:hypothetical protein OS493_032917 [Desmophyllum pertusum]